MVKIIRRLLCASFCILLAGCIISIDEKLPYAQLPEITVAAQVDLVASPSHPTAYFTSRPVPAGARAQVIGADKDAAWLLVVHEAVVGWMPTVYSRSNIGTLKPAIVVDPLSGTCTRYLGSTLRPDETWISNADGPVIVQGSIYRSQRNRQFDAASLRVEISAGGTATAGDYIHTPLTASSGLILFEFGFTNLRKGSRVRFALANTGGEPLSFQASFFSNDCPAELTAAGARFTDKLPIGKTQTAVPKRSTGPRSSGALSTALPSQVGSTPLPAPTPVIIKIESGLASGVVTSAELNLRAGPGLEYDPPITVLNAGAQLLLIGYNTANDGSVWWHAQTSSGVSGWVHSKHVAASGAINSLPKAPKPPAPTPKPTPIPTPRPIASNRGALTQGQNGWSYQYEQGRNSANFTNFTDRRSYDGIDCYVSPREDYVRLCADGELHPGQQSRVAYRWDSGYSGPVTIRVHAHKLDTRCGDGVWVGTYLGDAGRAPQKLGEFEIGGSDHVGTTRAYPAQVSTNSFILVMVDIRRQAQCDQSRVFIDILRR